MVAVSTYQICHPWGIQVEFDFPQIYLLKEKRIIKPTCILNLIWISVLLYLKKTRELHYVINRQGSSKVKWILRKTQMSIKDNYKIQGLQVLLVIGFPH